MPVSGKPLMELLRNTPPPTIKIQDSMRSIPPPPLCPPPLPILKMVPPPPLPGHVTRNCPPQIFQIPLNQAPANNGQSPHVHGKPRGMDPTYQDFCRAPVNESKSKYTLADSSPLNKSPVGRSVISETFDTSGDRVTPTASGETADTPEGVSDSERSAASDAAELVIVLRNLVNLFTVTSQVKSALARIRTKADDTGMAHQVGRTRSLVETFREQLARRTVMLGRLIPPGTTGKPEIPREIRTKDLAGGDVSPQLDPPPSPPDGGARAAVLSLQALVSADAEESSNGASRWGSRVKRRFLAATKPTRRHCDRLKGPTAGNNWQSSEVTLTSVQVRADSSSEDDSQRGGYISPGCYVIDGAGLPREGADSREGEPAPSANSLAMFGVPLSVMISEASKRKKKAVTSTAPTGGTPTADSSRLDRSWRASCNLVPRLVCQAEMSAENLQNKGPPDLDATLVGLSKMNLDEAKPPSGSPRGHNCTAPPLSSTPQRKHPIPSQEKIEPTDEEEGVVSTPRSRDSEEGSWQSMSFEEDWFVSAEREERERECAAKSNGGAM